MDLQALAVKLFQAEAVKFGSYKLKSGVISPIYIDLRVIISYPDILELVAEHIWLRVKECNFSLVCGVPYTALPIATCLSLRHNIPMLIRRKEPKDYGTKKMVEGKFSEGDKCLIVEDVVTSGSSVLETVESLRTHGVAVTDAVVLVNREQGGTGAIGRGGVTLHSVMTITELADQLVAAGCISNQQACMVREFVRSSQVGETLNVDALLSASAAVVTVESVVLRLHDIGSFKFGEYKLSNGLVTPIYMDLRLVISHPEVMTDICKLLWDMIAADKSLKFDLLCGVPLAALHLATCIAKDHNVAQVLARAHAKTYGTKRRIEGAYKAGNTCLVVEDIMVSGEGVYSTAQCLRSGGLIVSDAVTVIDREQSAESNLLKKGIKTHCLIRISHALNILVAHGRIEQSVADSSLEFLRSNPTAIPESIPVANPDRQALPYAERAQLCTHSLAKELFTIMDKKQTNLCLAVDVTSPHEVLQIANELGPYICMLKTHVDILENFPADFPLKLQELAAQHNFLIFEDRKFADIGHTAELQYSSGVFKTAQWAHIVNAHSLPGEGLVQGLKKVGQPLGRGCLLVAEMSSSGSLTTNNYANETLKMAENHKDFVIGFISQSLLTSDPTFLHMTPGVSLSTSSGDGLGQQYVSPGDAVRSRGADIVIVGRSIVAAADRKEACVAHQQAAYAAYESLLMDGSVAACVASSPQRQQKPNWPHGQQLGAGASAAASASSHIAVT